MIVACSEPRERTLEAMLYAMPPAMARRYVARYRPDFVDNLRALRRRTTYHGKSLRGYDANACIFVRIPKCASQSVATSLFGNRGGGHTEIWKYRLAFDETEFAAYFKFAFVRNPWDRLLSAYRFLCRGGFDHWDQQFYAENLAHFADFGDFVRRWVTPARVRTWIHFRPQVEFVCDATGAILVDFVGRYETLQDDFDVVARRLQRTATLGHVNTSHRAHQDYRSAYADDTAAIVEAVYAQDIGRFGYQFDPAP